MSPSDWLQRHSAVSDEEFAKDPSRSRFSILLSRKIISLITSARRCLD